MTESGPPQIAVFVFREGLLSAVGHDVKLTVSRVEASFIEEPPAVTLRCDPRSLKVACAMRQGIEDPLAFTAAERGQIEQTIVEEILEARRYGELAFESTRIVAGWVTGRLTLHGATREVSGSWREEAGRRVAEITLDQRAFGIKPYRAMLGALKIKPEVLVRASLPAPR